MKKNLKIAACYIRVSTDKQEELSPDSQLKEIKKWAKDNGYILSNEYIFMENEGVSGRKAAKRDEFQRMIAIAKTKPKPFDAILVWKFSRFARNQEESTFYKGLLRKKLNIDVISISEPIIEGMFGRLIEMIIEWFDEYYSVNLSGEVMRGMTEKATRGGYQSDTPYGYRMDKETHIPVVIPDEADVVKHIFTSFAAGSSASSIARGLNAKGVRTKRGNSWELRTIDYVLSNPFYMGSVRWNRQHHESHTIKDSSEWIIAPGMHEAIISEELFGQAQALMAKRTSMRKIGERGVGNKYWLSGLIKCDTCGSSLFAGGKTSGGTRYLQCGAYVKGKCQVSHAVTERKIIDGMITALTMMLKSSDLSSYAKAAIVPTRLPETKHLEDALARLVQKEARIKQAYMDGIDTIDEYRANKQLLTDERIRIKNDIDNILNSKPEKIEQIDLPKEIQSIIDLLKSNVENDLKSDAIRSVIDHLVYVKKENRLDIHLVDSLKTL